MAKKRKSQVRKTVHAPARRHRTTAVPTASDVRSNELDVIEGRLQRLEQGVDGVRKRLDDLAEIVSSARSQAVAIEGDFTGVKRELDVLARNVTNVVARINQSQIAERDSGTRRSSLGKLSDEGAVPVDPRPIPRQD
jgi:septal ring factor EnvC (AmiA/AmiB activator)